MTSVPKGLEHLYRREEYYTTAVSIPVDTLVLIVIAFPANHSAM